MKLEGFLNNVRDKGSWNKCAYKDCEKPPVVHLSTEETFLCQEHYNLYCDIEQKSWEELKDAK